MTVRLAAAMLALAVTPALAHRLDEYLQATILSVDHGRLQAQMTLTPGVAVYPIVLAQIDTDADGVISASEQRAYAAGVLRDLSLAIDGRPLTPRLVSMQFPATAEMQEGRGAIVLEFAAELPRNGPNRTLTLENRHQSRIAAYQVNCLVPRDLGIRIVAQRRDYLQAHYELDYVQSGLDTIPLALAWWSGDRGWLVTVALLLFARFAFLWRQRTTASIA